MSERRYQFTDTRNIEYTYFLERAIISVTKYPGNPCIKPGTIPSTYLRRGDRAVRETGRATGNLPDPH